MGNLTDQTVLPCTIWPGGNFKCQLCQILQTFSKMEQDPAYQNYF